MTTYQETLKADKSLQIGDMFQMIWQGKDFIASVQSIKIDEAGVTQITSSEWPRLEPWNKEIRTMRLGDFRFQMESWSRIHTEARS